MGVAIPQIITEDRASGALVVDGSLRFDSAKSNYLTRTPASTSSQTTWTWSGWVKRSSFDSTNNLFAVYPGSNFANIRFVNQNIDFAVYNGGSYSGRKITTAVFRDPSAWYHIVATWDTTNGTAADRMRLYVNSVRVDAFSTSTDPSSSATSVINTAVTHRIGTFEGSTEFFNGYLSSVYFIDGQALDASYFGYTDALTNTWRPKKLSSSVAFGTNGFYLPFDGSAPIGQDQSGRGNNWTPVNFGGSNTLEKATGALPILNTDGGGKVARVGVRTDSSASSLVLALPLVGIKSDFSNAVNSGTSNKAITLVGSTSASSSSSMFYSGSFYFDGNADCVDVSASSDFAFGTGDFTVECWVNTSTYSTDTVYRRIFMTDGPTGNASGNFQLIIDISAGALYLWSNTGDLDYVTSGIVANGNWNHIAACRSGSTLRAFVNGIQVGSTTYSGSISPNSGTPRPRIGNYDGSGGGGDFSGYIQDVRIYKGVAKYTQNFIPASTDPDILPDTPSGVSYTSNLIPTTDGAVFFDGSGDYLSLGYNTDIDLSGSGTNFTVEAFIYKTSAEEDQIVEFRGGGSTGWTLYAKTDNTLQVYDSSGGVLTASSGSIILNVWNHIALTKNGSGSNNCTYWINGVSAGTFTLSSFAATDSTGLRIGASKDTAAFLTGFISNLHVVKGTALYTSNFTPPTGPISSVANTKLLCCASNTSSNAVSVSPGSYSNGGTTWSSAGNFSGDVRSQSDTYGPPKMFNGIIGNENATNAVCFAPYSSNSTCTWTSPVSFTGLSSLRIYVDLSGTTGKLTVNGTDYSSLVTALSGGDGWITIPQSSLSTISFGYTGGLNSATGICAVEVNGTVLIDNFNGKAIARAGDAVATNFNPFTVNINTQRGKQSGYCTLNPLDRMTDNPSNGNLTWYVSSANHRGVRSTIKFPSSGKFYYEAIVGTASGTMAIGVGMATPSATPGYNNSGTWFIVTNSSVTAVIRETSNSTITAMPAPQIGDILQVAYDADGGKVWFGKNNIWAGATTGTDGNPGAGTNPTVSGFTVDHFPCVTAYQATLDCNFGQKPFKFPPPAGFQPLALANTPRPTIVRPDQFVGVATYSGTGAASRPVTNLGFKPDFVWIKNRSSGSYSHQLFDSVRGASAGCLYSDLTNAQDSNFPITSFDTSGFTLGSSASLASQSYASQNGSGSNYVGWAWKAGGNSNTYNINDVGYATASAAGLTAGSITPTGASVNTKSGFSIITWTKASTSDTISHGLGVAPKFIICKSRTSATDWMIGHSGLDATSPWNYRIYFDTGARNPDGSTSWGGVPTSTVFYAGNTSLITGNMVAYCWAEIPGFSKFGSYTGNGSSDGPTIITGFRPKFFMIKRSDASGEYWQTLDSVRDTYNVASHYLSPNYAGAEGSVALVDFLSNGVKIRYNTADFNSSGGTYIYAAFAETPTQNLYGAQSNAR
jgi:hypothetical protein